MSAEDVRAEARKLAAEYLEEARVHDAKATAPLEVSARRYHVETAEALRWIAEVLGGVRDATTARAAVDRFLDEMSRPQPEGKHAALDEAVLRLEVFAAPSAAELAIGADRDEAAAVTLLRALLLAEDQAELRRRISADPERWHAGLHSGFGSSVRNSLREYGFTEQSLGIADMDEGWPALVVKAVGVSDAVNRAPERAVRHGALPPSRGGWSWTDVLDTLEIAPSTDFYFGSPLLGEVWRIPHPELTRLLVWRHQALGNKAAPSARALRHVIKHHDGRDFSRLWHMFDDAGDDPMDVEDLPRTGSWLWAAANVLGEMGGSRVIEGVYQRLLEGDGRKDAALIRLALHLAYRYRDVSRVTEPMAFRLDVSTGTYSQVPLTQLGPESGEKVRLWRRVDDEFFLPTPVGRALADLLDGFDEDLVEGVIEASPYVPGTDHIVERLMGMHLKNAREKGESFVLGAMESIPRPHGIGSRVELLEALKTIG